MSMHAEWVMLECLEVAFMVEKEYPIAISKLICSVNRKVVPKGNNFQLKIFLGKCTVFILCD
jgi:hypothetical protein